MKSDWEKNTLVFCYSNSQFSDMHIAQSCQNTVQIFSSKVVVLSYIITQSSRVQIFSQLTLQRGFPKDDLSVSVRCMDQFVNLDTNMVLVLVPRYPLHSALKKGKRGVTSWSNQLTRNTTCITSQNCTFQDFRRYSTIEWPLPPTPPLAS